MHLLRSTHRPLSLGFPILLEVSHLSHMDVDLLYSLIAIWLYRNCKNEWSLEQVEETTSHHTFIRLVFSDPSEAMYYKLSSSYVHNKPIMVAFQRKAT